MQFCGGDMQIEQAIKFTVEHINELVFFFDKRGQILFANAKAKELTEYGEEICNISIEEIFPQTFEFKNGIFCEAESLVEEEAELNAYRFNRTCFPVMAKVIRYVEPDTYIVIACDATEKNLLERQNEQIQQEADSAAKVKSEFIANVTHELRTPVNGILGNTRELVEIETDKEKQKLLALIERGCADMNAIISNILDFSKLEAGKFTLETRRFHFRDMIDYVKSNHKNKITEKGLDFLVTVAPDIPEYVIGDELRIVQILNNLLSNACKFTSVGRIVLEVVRTAQVGEKIELFFLVIDTGIGIDKAGQDKLFKSFSQVDASISRRFGGTGLGLNISKQLVELMNGDIHVESEIGKGSMFSFHVWLNVPRDELEHQAENGSVNIPSMESLKAQSVFGEEETSEIWLYGTETNLEEIKKKASKLILCVEMENWEKAEGFADVLKQLTDKAPQEVRSAALRLKMAVQKADYEKTTAAFEKLKTEVGLE